jgi:hypothetical protein
MASRGPWRKEESVEFDVLVEIPKGQRNKYEVDHESGRIRLDRTLFTSTQYPADYGFIENTLGLDGDPLVLAMGALVVTDVVGGVVAVQAGVNTWGEAWGSSALLAAPVPMIAAQVALTALAVRLRGKRAAIPAGMLSAACLVSVVSGFFDGGIGHEELTPALSAYQVLLLAVTGVVGVLAARRAWSAARQ